MWGGILFSPPAEAHALVAGFMSGTIRNPCFRRDDRAQSLVATLAERYRPAEQAWPSRRPRETAISGIYHVLVTSERSSVPAGVGDTAMSRRIEHPEWASMSRRGSRQAF